ncbi:MAG: uroporphyrinogen-III synthase [Pseudomonadota bacterium]
MTDNGAPLILLTRPRAQSERFARSVQSLAETKILPLQEIVPTDPIPSLDGIFGLIFTSENGVATFVEASSRRDVVAFCVGERGAIAARAAGMVAQSVGRNADELVAFLLSKPPAGTVMHLHGTHVRGDVAARLAAGGISVKHQSIYDQRAVTPAEPISQLGAGRTVFAPLFSARSASLFAAAVGRAPGDWRCLCLSHAVRDALPPYLSARAKVATCPTAEAIRDLMALDIFPSP